MTQITSYTSNEEVQSIYDDEDFKNDDGTVNYDAIQDEILSGTSDYDIEDLLTAYITGTGSLPPSLMAPEGYLGDPETYSYLWDDAVVSSLQQLSDLYVGTSLEAQIAAFLTSTDSAGLTDSTGILGEVGTFLEGYDIANSEDIATDVYNLFNVNDLTEVMALFVSLGVVGMALLLYTAYALNPAMQKLQDAALDVISDSSDQMDDLLSDLEGISVDDLDAQYQSQAISQQLSVVAQVISTMTTFIADAQKIGEEMLQLSAKLSDEKYRTDQTIRG